MSCFEDNLVYYYVKVVNIYIYIIDVAYFYSYLLGYIYSNGTSKLFYLFISRSYAQISFNNIIARCVQVII